MCTQICKPRVAEPSKPSKRRNDKWKSGLDLGWNNPDFEYYLLDINILYDIVSGKDEVLAWLKSLAGSTIT